ncbi:MAG: multidrug efflux RND transporter permease subunit [Desulfobaccales bacterium]
MSKFFIHRPIFAIVIALVILIAGLVSIFSLPIAQYPPISPPTVTVETFFVGASARVVEENVAVPIEQEVNGAENMLYMSSRSTSDGRYFLTCTFAVGTDIDIAQVDVQNRVNRADRALPSEVKSYGITVKKASPDMLIVLSLFSPDNTYDDLFLSNYALLNLYDPISRVNGVGDITIVGEREYAMRLWVRPDRLANLGLTARDVAQAVQDQNVQAPAGQVGQPPAKSGLSFQYSVDVKGRLTDKEEFDNIIIRTQPDGSILRVKDVAETELGARRYTSFSRRGGKPATTIVIFQLPGANALDVASDIRTIMEEAKRSFPPGLAYEVSYDNTLFVRAALKEVVFTLFKAIGLVMLVVFIFLGNFRATLVPILVVPIPLVGTFATFMALGFSINTLSLFGLVLAIGSVMDDAIVVVEAVKTHMAAGLTPLAATEKSMDEVTNPIIGVACALISVYVPVAFLGGIVGQLYRQFALTLCVAATLSIVVALTLTPALCVLILRPKKDIRGPLGSFLRGFDRLFARTTAGYLNWLKFFMRRLGLALIILVAVFVGAGTLLKTLPGGLVPDEDQGVVFATFTLPPGASLERTDAVLSRGEQFAAGLPGVQTILGWGGFNLMNSTFASDVGTLVMTLAPWEDRTSAETQLTAIMQRLRREFAGYPEARTFVYTLPSIPGMGNVSGFQYMLQDRSAQTPVALFQTAQSLAATARQEPAIAAIFNTFQANVPQVKLEVDRDKVQTLGIPLRSVFDGLQLYLGGFMINDFNKFGRVYRVMIQAKPEFRRNPEDIRNIYVRNADNKMVPLSTLVQVGSQTGPININRYNMFRAAELTGQNAPGFSSGEAIATMERLSQNLPRGFGYEWTGLAFQEKLAGGQTAYIFAFSLIFVFLVLAALYESWAIPVGILLGLPVSVLGALAGVWLRGLANDVYVQVGIVMLIGLNAKLSIMIVEFARNKRDVEGLSTFDAAAEGARLRFRAILMTALAEVVGLSPLLLASGAGAAARWSVGTAIVAGMATAAALSVFFIPVLYYAVQTGMERLQGPGAAPALAKPGGSDPAAGGKGDAS